MYVCTCSKGGSGPYTRSVDRRRSRSTCPESYTYTSHIVLTACRFRDPEAKPAPSPSLSAVYICTSMDRHEESSSASLYGCLALVGGGGTCRFHARSWRRKANGRPGSASPPNMRFTLPPARSWYVAADTLGVLRLSSYCR